MKLKLVKPSKKYQAQIIDMLDEWSEYNKLHPECDKSPRAIFRDYSNFKSYIKNFEKDIYDPSPDRVPATVYFALDKEKVLEGKKEFDAKKPEMFKEIQQKVEGKK